jgi:hypothetical protein
VDAKLLLLPDAGGAAGWIVPFLLLLHPASVAAVVMTVISGPDVAVA